MTVFKNKNNLTGKASSLCLLFLFVAGVVVNFQPQVARADTASLSATAVGGSDAWTVNAGSKVDAVASNDGDTSFISSANPCVAGNPCDAETFTFPGAAVPSGATINSVTLTVLAKKGAGDSGVNPQIKLLAQNTSNTAVDKAFGTTVKDDTNYVPITWVMNTNPLTHAAWTVAEVNAWATNFGVSKVDIFGTAVMVTQISLSVDYSVHPAPLANPPLAAQMCGLDIALVIDNSGSIDSNLTTTKTAFNNFVSELLPSTPTDFSVTYFDGTAHYAQQTFSNNASTTRAAINSVPSPSGQTDWEDGLIKAAATFDPRPGTAHPNVIIFASDGQPNRYGPNGSLGVGGTVDQNALDAAVVEANTIKAAGTRIVTLGIGSGVVQSNMVDISSSDAYYSVADFSHLAATLNTIAGQMCGGTITVSKKLDVDGNLSTTNDQTNGGSGFSFNVTPGLTNQVTDTNGQTPAIAVTAGSYSVSEVNVPSGYTALGGVCRGATNNGSASGTTVTGVTVGTSDIVSCIFYNQPPGGSGGGGGGTSTPSSTDVSIVKTVNHGTANPGDTVVYTLVVHNAGPATSTGVTATDTLPSGVTFVSATSTVGSYNASTSVWNIGTLVNGASATTTITAKVNAGTAGQVVVNTATVSSTSTDSNLNNNSSSATVTVNNSGGGGGGSNPTSSDVSILKTVDKPTANAGDTVHFSLVVTNSGPATATGVVASDTLPSGLTFVSATSTVGIYNTTTSLWTIGTLLSGASATTTITATVNSTSTNQSITNTATVTSTSTDSNPNNNSSSATTTVNSSTGGCTVNCGGGGTSPSADLSLTKTVDNSAPNPGDTVVYTLVVHNAGPNDASSVVATDTLPSTVTFVSATSTLGSYNASTSLWTIGTLLNGAYATTTIIATVNAGTAGQSIPNSASVGSTVFDPNMANNSSSAGSNVPNPGGSSGGCTVNCGGSSGGGNPTTNSSTSGGGSPTGNGSTGSNFSSGLGFPQGQILAASTNGPSVPTPQVLGAATTLPRTGTPLWEVLILLLGSSVASVFIVRKQRV